MNIKKLCDNFDDALKIYEYLSPKKGTQLVHWLWYEKECKFWDVPKDYH